jgi:hypothetical protein
MRLYITEYAQLQVQAPLVPPVREQSISIELKSTQSLDFELPTRFIVVKAAARCALAFGKNPVADPNMHVLDAGETRTYGVTTGDRLAVIASEDW